MNIHVQGIRGTADVRVEIFTLAFRKVQERTFQRVPEGSDISVELRDRGGYELANGLYYVRVQVGAQHQIVKLLVMR